MRFARPGVGVASSGTRGRELRERGMKPCDVTLSPAFHGSLLRRSDAKLTLYLSPSLFVASLSLEKLNRLYYYGTLSIPQARRCTARVGAKSATSANVTTELEEDWALTS